MKLSYNNYTARFCDGGVEVFKGDTLLYFNKRPMYAFIKTALAVTEFYDAPTKPSPKRMAPFLRKVS